MKKTRLIVALLGCAALMQGTTYASPRQQAPSPSSTIATGDSRGHVQQTPRVDATNRNHSSPLSNNAQFSVWGKARNIQAPSSTKSATTAGAPAVQSKAGRSISLIRRDIPRGNAFSPGGVRHRGFNPAIVGGYGNANMKGSGAINGTRMNHRQ